MRVDAAILDIRTAEDIRQTASRLLGQRTKRTGVVHVTAVWDAGGGHHFTLDINPQTPFCYHDSFVLNFCRARADAIVTTGQILRREPTLSHQIQGPAKVPRALMDWRERVLGKSNPPVSLVLTSGQELDFGHPLFHHWSRPLVYTSFDGQWSLESQAMSHGVEIVGVENPSPRGALDLLRREFGAATILIEAGPSVSRQLYEPDLLVDELVLSTFGGHRLPASVQGGGFPSRQDLDSLFANRTSAARVTAESGPWTFQRYWRG